MSARQVRRQNKAYFRPSLKLLGYGDVSFVGSIVKYIKYFPMLLKTTFLCRSMIFNNCFNNFYPIH